MSSSGRARVVRHGDPEARAHEHLAVRKHHGLLERIAQAHGDPRGLGQAQALLAQHHELIAAEARERVLGAQQLRQPPRHLDEHAIAAVVAEAVVDRLEVVDVDEEDRHLPARRPLQALERHPEAVEEQRAVGQVGERIVHRPAQKGTLGPLALERVAQRPRDRRRVDAPDQVVLGARLQRRDRERLVVGTGEHHDGGLRRRLADLEQGGELACRGWQVQQHARGLGGLQVGEAAFERAAPMDGELRGGRLGQQRLDLNRLGRVVTDDEHMRRRFGRREMPSRHSDRRCSATWGLQSRPLNKMTQNRRGVARYLR